ncbi:MAG: preprotein translocase subunit SecE [Fusobacteria bacterium]|nr:preprotein translocase subunit SecE [Fusobacteriota bacterium]
MAIKTKEIAIKDKGKKPVKANKPQGKKTNLFKGMISELKKVTWPTKKEVLVYTIIVVVTVIVFTIIIGFYDLILKYLIEFLLSL